MISSRPPHEAMADAATHPPSSVRHVTLPVHTGGPRPDGRRAPRVPRTPGGSSRCGMPRCSCFPGFVLVEPRWRPRAPVACSGRWRSRRCRSSSCSPATIAGAGSARSPSSRSCRHALGWGGQRRAGSVAAGARVPRGASACSSSRCGCGSSPPTATATPSRRSCWRSVAPRSSSACVFTGKTWCNYVCPVSFVEKLYTEPRGLRDTPNSQCTHVHGVPAGLPGHQRGEQLLEGDPAAREARRVLRVSRGGAGVLRVLLPAVGHVGVLLRRRLDARAGAVPHGVRSRHRRAHGGLLLLAAAAARRRQPR